MIHYRQHILHFGNCKMINITTISSTNYLYSEEFRLGVYIFALLSAVPIALFLLFSIVTILVTTTLLSIVGTAIILTIIGFTLMLLIPLLIVSLLTSGLAILIYSLYCYFTQSKQKPKTSPKYNVHDGEVVAN